MQLQMWAAPIDYEWVSSSNSRRFAEPAADFSKPSNPILRGVQDVLTYCAVHSFGRRMLYPGSVALLKTLLSSTLIENRRKLVRTRGAQRALLLAADGNRIDAMFVDRRNTTHANGNTLVVTFEGNAGFYEQGTMATPLEAGYSVLGWNHPGEILFFFISERLPFLQDSRRAPASRTPRKRWPLSTW